MKARAGFTLLELLIALGLGMGVLAIAIQQLTEFFRLQGVLMARTEMREELQLAQRRIRQKLSHAVMLENAPNNDGFIAVVPVDTDRCGYICKEDTYEVVWWRTYQIPFKPQRMALTELRANMPAFVNEPDVKSLTQYITHQEMMHPHHELGATVNTLEITRENTNCFRTLLTASRSVPGQKDPVTLSLTELVASRSLPYADMGTPTFAAVLARINPKGAGQ